MCIVYSTHVTAVGEYKCNAMIVDGNVVVVDGSLSAASFLTPTALALDNRSGNIFVTDINTYSIRIITLESGGISGTGKSAS